MSTKTKPTEGAIRAAKALGLDVDYRNALGLSRWPIAAEIIDRETAAPELLEACKAALERLERVDDRDVMEQLEAAIQKAEGRQK